MTGDVSSGNPPTASGGLIRGLLRPDAYPHPVRQIELIETHISWIFLTGDYAYKVKKPVDLGFLDFSDLARRRTFCEDELRLNSRTAADIYLGVVPIGGTLEAPKIGEEPAIEYAVRMRQFDQGERLDFCLERGDLGTDDMTAAADAVARFHAGLPPADPDSAYGSPRVIAGSILENFAALERLLPVACAERDEAESLQAWSEERLAMLGNEFRQRRRGGKVRECHGDLHLANMVRIDGDVVMFDCLEFSPDLRWTDVMSEVAFLAMDLHARGRPDLASWFLNEYLQITGDYAGLAVYRFYIVYRAMVRTKVAAIRWDQTEGTPRENAWRDLTSYLDAAAELAHSMPSPGLIITHGFSGSGKTYEARRLRSELGAIHIRSDIERKRLHGLAGDTQAGLGVGAGHYDAAATEKTYRRLLDLARIAIAGGYSVILDATYLRQQHRSAAAQLARDLGVAFTILSCVADEEVLRQRIRQRAKKGTDASEADLAVLEHQLRESDPLTAAEKTFVERAD